MANRIIRRIAGILGWMLGLGLATAGAEEHYHFTLGYDGPWRWHEVTMTTTVQGEYPNQTTYYKGTASITGYVGNATSLTIPKKISWTGSVSTTDGSVDLTYSYEVDVVGIGDRAFWGKSSLTSVTIPNSVTNIGVAAFWCCSGLTSVTILGNVTNDTSPFINCTNLTTLVLGEEMTKVGNRMFYACSGLMSVTIPNNVTSIGNSAFENCSNLTSMAIGNGVTNIGTHVFSGCNSLESFSVASDNPAFKSVDGLLLTKDGKTLLYGVNGDVVIPDGVTELSTYAFNNYGELTSIVIPNSVIRFPTEAFDGCDKLWISWYRTLANLAAGSGASGGLPGDAGKTVSFTVTNVIVHYVTQSLPGDAVTPSTNSTGIVNIVAEVTAGKAIAISEDWAKQYPGFAEQYGADFSAALTMENGKRDGTGAPMYVWQDYVAGTDPTDPASVFTASVTFDAETGEPVISWSPELSPEEAAKRLYTVSGKVKMTDPDWLPLDGNASDFNFYRVTVEMK